MATFKLPEMSLREMISNFPEQDRHIKELHLSGALRQFDPD